ncbi:MAG: protein-L-isoaspartate O-methyltransferase [Flammeovirgaceae bacterium]|nr:protein-L-isoaspartate O-methyltransferase [Flammeovirgaceae bacterium]HCX24271.1 protein-L-isoaspartate O-methyltransferase [Cytophagales bacterium]|tara:strand:- start:220 stop:840 length:621 start_codon:yes stop_codon:yes gene_type:complete
MRKLLIKEVAAKGIKDQRVLEAMMILPRHFFFDDIFVTHAYEDKAFPIGQGQTISQPYTVAFQTEQLEIKPGDKILEIGTGSGYQAAILLELGADVYTIEYNKVLYEKTKLFLPQLGYKPRFFHGDGSKGLPEYAPYDGIIVTAGAPSLPQDLVKQLKVGGKLIIPVGNNKTQVMYRLTKVAENKISKKAFNNFSFVPLRGEKGWK